MAHVWADRVAETTTTTGTGALALSLVNGFQRFSAVCSVNDTVIYAIEAVDGSGVPTGDWEVGVGTYSALNTLTRTTVIKSSNSNAAVSFAAGTKNVFLDDIASTRNTLQQYSGTSEPSAPVEGLIYFAKDFNGLAVPYARGANGRSFALDPWITGRPVVTRAVPRGGGSTTIDALGFAFSNYGTQTTAALANTNAVTRFARLGCSTSATASTAAGVRETVAGVFCRGTNALDGFRVVCRWSIETVGNTNCRWFVGLMPTGQASATTDPASTSGNWIGVGAAAADTTNAKLYSASASASSSVDLGANYPAKTAQGGMFELVLWAEASASAVKYQVRRLDDLTIAPTTGSLSTNIPTAGTQLFLQATINNNATAAASIIGFGGFYQETGIG